MLNTLNILITPKDLKQRAVKIWQRGDIHRAWLQKTSIFPLEIPLKNISAKHLLAHFSELQASIYDLRKDSKKHSYFISGKEMVHRQLGSQKIPATIVFETETVFLSFITKITEFNQFKKLTEHIMQHDGLFQEWVVHYPAKVMKYADVWPGLLNVCAYFKHNKKPDCYIRQLDIKGVDSKFIEQHKGILNELLPQVLTETSYQKEIVGLTNHGFERRYGLRYDQPLIRLRILDKGLAIHGLTDLTLTVEAFKTLNLASNTVFIAENKINGLAFPDYSQAIVIFGLGYAVNLLADAVCLKNSTIYYWGDIDTHGFAILSRLRHYYPRAKSLLMEQKTLEQFMLLSVHETLEKSEQKALSHLTDVENKLYQQLQNSLVRLEQERISFSCLQQVLKKLGWT